MYINKAKRKTITELTLAVKVHGKNAEKERAQHGATPLWHEMWDACEYCHKALLVLLGDHEQLDYLQHMAQSNQQAEQALRRIQKHIGA
jgi:hypothetical protein